MFSSATGNIECSPHKLSRITRFENRTLGLFWFNNICVLKNGTQNKYLLSARRVTLYFVSRGVVLQKKKKNDNTDDARRKRQTHPRHNLIQRLLECDWTTRLKPFEKGHGSDTTVLLSSCRPTVLMRQLDVPLTLSICGKNASVAHFLVAGSHCRYPRG